MKFAILCLGLILAAPVLAESAPAVSALVQTVPLRHMTLATRVDGYGTVEPNPTATENLNLPRAGQVIRVLVNQGQAVKQGQPLLELGADPVGLLAYRQAKSALAFARQDLERVRQLRQRQLATVAQVDAAKKTLQDARQALQTQIALGDGDHSSVLKAPFAGVVMSLAVAQGDRIQAGTNLLQLSRTGSLQVPLGIEPGDSGQLKAGMPVKLVSVFNPSQTVTGTLAQLGGQVDPQTQLVLVTVRFNGGPFLPGSRVRGEIDVAGHQALAVPRSAVLRDDAGAYLFQIIGHKARRVDVNTGVDDGDWIEVSGSGLADAPVVSVGNYELEDGMAVREATR